MDMLQLPDHPQCSVVQRNDLHIESVLLACREFLNAHLNRSVTCNCDDVFAGESSLHPHRIRESDTHRAQAARIDPTARLVKRIELRGPHLMLTHVRTY